MADTGCSQQTPPGGALDPACFVRGEKSGNRRCARPAPGEGLMNPPLPRAGSLSPAAAGLTVPGCWPKKEPQAAVEMECLVRYILPAPT